MTDTENIDAIIDRFTPLVWTVCSGILGHNRRCDIEETVSDVFTAYWQARKYDESDNGVKNLLITIARRKAINRLKQLSRDVEGELDEELADAGLVDEEVIAKLDGTLIANAINSLPPPDAEIFTRRYYYCQSVREIARAIGLTSKQVENRLYRAKKTVREHLEKNGIKP